jgi:phosphoserine phosphatase RsbU/P
MAIGETAYLNTVRDQLLDRRVRLEEVLAKQESEQIYRLLSDVDQALERIEIGNFGVCEHCHGTVEEDRLMHDPLVTVCLDCFTPAQQRALESDLELAAQVQGSLLPPPDLNLPGWEICYHYRPLGVVSGDYCDFLSDGQGGLYFVIADVAGKGVAAAMLTANLRALFRALIPLGLPVDKLLAQASRLFRESTLPTQYATLIFGKATSAGELEIVNAGHLPGLLAGKSTLQVFDSTSLPLGLFSEQEFAVTKTKFAPGDTLVLYTDGLSEAQNRAGEEFGLDAMQKLIQSGEEHCPKQLIQACRERVEKFRDGGDRQDDETLLAIQYWPATFAKEQSFYSVA